jgi:hypothetical protein
MVIHLFLSLSFRIRGYPVYKDGLREKAILRSFLTSQSFSFGNGFCLFSYWESESKTDLQAGGLFGTICRNILYSFCNSSYVNMGNKLNNMVGYKKVTKFR